MRNNILFLFFVLLLGFGVFGSIYFFSNRVYRAMDDSTASMLDNIALRENINKEFKKSEEARKETNLFFVGDVMLSRGVAYQIKKNNDFNYPFLDVAAKLKTADFVFGNLEGPIASGGKNQGSSFSFRAEPGVVSGLKYAGFNLVSVANNHILDWGREALLETLDNLDKGGISYIGAGRNYEEANQPKIFEVNKVKIAFFGYTNLLPRSFEADNKQAGISDFNLDNIKKRISEVRNKVDLVVVSWHWGNEYDKRSNSNQQKLAQSLIDAGADLIVGHHPHVPEEIERYRNGWIIYSLGNFVFDQNFSADTMSGLMTRVKVAAGKIQDVESVPVKINNTFQPEF